MAMDLKNKVLEGLNEAPLLILGGQLALGIGLSDVPGGPWLKILAGVSMLLATALAVGPAGEGGAAVDPGDRNSRLQRFTARTRDAALLPFGLALGIDAFILAHGPFGPIPAALSGLGPGLWALSAWAGRVRPIAPVITRSPARSPATPRSAVPNKADLTR